MKQADVSCTKGECFRLRNLEVDYFSFFGVGSHSESIPFPFSNGPWSNANTGVLEKEDDVREAVTKAFQVRAF